MHRRSNAGGSASKGLLIHQFESEFFYRPCQEWFPLHKLLETLLPHLLRRHRAGCGRTLFPAFVEVDLRRVAEVIGQRLLERRDGIGRKILVRHAVRKGYTESALSRVLYTGTFEHGGQSPAQHAPSPG